MKLVSRRQVLRGGVQMAAATALSRTALAQLPAPEPLEDRSITFVSTTESAPWSKGVVLKPTFSWEQLNLNVNSAHTGAEAVKFPTMEGFGGCFNELGWTSLQTLNEADREAILREFFHPTEGGRFTYCRMPIGTNDYATEAYSYDEMDGDFELKHFSIDHDRNTLIPYIKAAKRYQPGLRLWASPWTPPSWMKRNHFYAEAAARPGWKDNGIRPDQIGQEGQDFFIQEPRYFEAYARYFARFIEAYRAEGIHVGMVMPQNEFNSAQNFPSCTWTPEGLAKFLHHLGPEMKKLDVDVFFGTLERGDPRLLEIVMADPELARLIKGVGTQWAGKNALPAISREFPNLMLYQTEQECGDGNNSWSYTGYCWQLMKHYFRSGARAYMYWNMATAVGGESNWGWHQNSLVSIDTKAKTFRYTNDYYLLKHLTHFVDIGATLVEVKGTFDDGLAFRNPDGTVVLLVRNELAHPVLVEVHVNNKVFAVNLQPDSVGTIAVKAV